MKTIKIVRVPYGRDDTPELFREYKLKDYPGSPVGTLDDWLKFAKENGFEGVDLVETTYVISAEQIKEKATEVHPKTLPNENVSTREQLGLDMEPWRYA